LDPAQFLANNSEAELSRWEAFNKELEHFKTQALKAEIKESLDEIKSEPDIIDQDDSETYEPATTKKKRGRKPKADKGGQKMKKTQEGI